METTKVSLQLEKKIIYTLQQLLDAGYVIARLKENRDFKPNNINSKKKSLKEHGQLVPSIIVSANRAIKEGLSVVEFFSGEPLKEEDINRAVVPVEGNHRLLAHHQMMLENENLKDGEEPYNRDFLFMIPMDETMSIKKMLTEINTVTDPWKGGDFVKGAVMSDKGKDFPLLEIISEYTSKGYSSDSVAKWFTGKDGCVTKDIMVNVINNTLTEKKEVKITVTEKQIERGCNLLNASRSSFSDSFLKSRTLVDWVFRQYDNADDDEKATEVEKLVHFLSNINRGDVDIIEKAKGKRGETTKEEIVFKKLNELYQQLSN